jgi:hypothetical protein
LGGNQLRYLRCSTNQEPTKRTYGRVARNVTAAPTKMSRLPTSSQRSRSVSRWQGCNDHASF